MNERDKALGRLLLLRNLCTRDALQQAGQTTLARRAAGQQVEILVVLVEMGVLTTEVARGLWNEVAAAAPVGAAPVGAAAGGQPRTGAFARPAAPPARPLSATDDGDFSPVSTLSTMGDEAPPRGVSPLGGPPPGGTGSFHRPATGSFARPAPTGFASVPGPAPIDDIALDDAPVSPVGFGPPPATAGWNDFDAGAVTLGPTNGLVGGFDAAPATGFGSGFGAPPPAFGAPNGSAFGMPAAPAGSSAFGMPAAPSAFGMPAAPTGNFGGFGAAPTNGPGTSNFGPGPGTSNFGPGPGTSNFGPGPGISNFGPGPGASNFGGPAGDLQSAFAPIGTATAPEAPTNDVGGKGSARTKKGSSGRSPGGAGSARLSKTRAGGPPPRKSGPPVVAIALSALVVVGGSVGAFMFLKPKSGAGGPGTATDVATATDTPTTTTPTTTEEDPTPIVDRPVVNTKGDSRGTELVMPETAPPTKAETDAQSWIWAEELLIRAWDLREKERYDDAVKVLEGFPRVLQGGEGFQKVQEKLAEYSRFSGFKKKLEAAIAAGSASEDLKTFVGRIESGKMERDLLELPCINRFKEEARRVLSPAVYDEIAVKWMDIPNEVESTPPDGE